jgi:hypothetical protein
VGIYSTCECLEDEASRECVVLWRSCGEVRAYN